MNNNYPNRTNNGSQSQNSNQHRSQDKEQDKPRTPMPKVTLDIEQDSELFCKKAEEVAKALIESVDRGDANKSTQLRSFYDELVTWEQKAQKPDANFSMILPYVKMMIPKAEYAKGRGLVNPVFTTWFKDLIKQITDVKTLTFAKLHFEAVCGFLKGMNK